MCIKIEIGCWNFDCKHYWEDMCLREWKENEVMTHDRYGICMKFEEGINEAYQMRRNDFAKNKSTIY